MKLYKQMALLCKLVGLIGREETQEHKNNLALSYLKQKMSFLAMLKPSKKSINLWKEFIVWLKSKEIITTCNFSSLCESKFQTSNNKNYVREIKEDGIKVCHRNS